MQYWMEEKQKKTRNLTGTRKLYKCSTYFRLRYAVLEGGKAEKNQESTHERYLTVISLIVQ